MSTFLSMVPFSILFTYTDYGFENLLFNFLFGSCGGKQSKSMMSPIQFVSFLIIWQYITVFHPFLILYEFIYPFHYMFRFYIYSIPSIGECI